LINKYEYYKYEYISMNNIRISMSFFKKKDKYI